MSLNRTFVELKRAALEAAEAKKRGLNRTFVELKPMGGDVCLLVLES